MVVVGLLVRRKPSLKASVVNLESEDGAFLLLSLRLHENNLARLFAEEGVSTGPLDFAETGARNNLLCWQVLENEGWNIITMVKCAFFSQHLQSTRCLRSLGKVRGFFFTFCNSVESFCFEAFPA